MNHHYQRKKILLIHTYYTNVKRICDNFEIGKLDEYHDLFVQSDTLLLADVCNKFWNMS